MTDQNAVADEPTPDPSEVPAPSIQIRDRIVLFAVRDGGIGLVLLAVTLIFIFTADNFATKINMLNLLVQIAINTVLAVGMTFVILVGGIDLSVGAVLSLATVVGAKVMIGVDVPVGMAIALGVLSCVAVGALAGLINGYIIERWAIPSFIVTLGMLNIARGLAQVISDNRTINGLPQGFVEFGRHLIVGWVPLLFIIAISTVIAAWFVLRYTVFGRYVYATGTNAEAVRLAGHNTKRIRILAFTICGLTAGIGSVVFLLRLNVGSPTSGVGYELDAIAAVILGGTSLLGGKGSVLGTFFGACLLQVLATGLQLLGLDDNYRTIVVGVVIIVAVIIDTYRLRFVRRIAIAT